MRGDYQSRALRRAFGAFLLAAAATAQPSFEEWRSEPLSWRGDVAAGAPITLVNEHGDLRIRGKPRDELELVGYRQRHADDPREIAVEPVRDGEGWRLEVRTAGEPGEEVPAEWAGRRVDLTVYIPWSSPLTVRTTDGVLEALDLRAPLTAETAAGELTAGSSSNLAVTTRGGAVRVLLQGPDWAAKAVVETFSGPVTVWARPDADAAVTLETRGTLITDFTLEVERLDPSLRRARARLNAGTGTVHVTSYQAPLALREIVPGEMRPAGAGADG